MEERIRAIPSMGDHGEYFAGLVFFVLSVGFLIFYMLVVFGSFGIPPIYIYLFILMASLAGMFLVIAWQKTNNRRGRMCGLMNDQ